MATDWNEMKEYFLQETAGKTFRPYAHYDPDSDALTFYFSNEADHGRRLNSRVTIYLADESGELVGCRIKGVHAVLEDIGSFDVSIAHGKVKLTMLFVALHGTFSNDPDARSLYRQLGRRIGELDLEVQVPASV